MPTEPLVDWQVQISATGVEEAKSAAQQVAEAMQGQEKAVEKTRQRTRALRDEVTKTYRDVGGLGERMKKAYQASMPSPALAAAMGKRYREAMAPPPGIRRAFADEFKRAKEANDRLARGMKDGSLRVLGQQRREFERMNKEAKSIIRQDELRAKLGPRLGGFAARNEGWARPTGRVGMMTGGTAMAAGSYLAHRGMAGTVEEARLSTELDLAGREVGALFKPEMKMATDAVKSFRQGMEQMSPGMQKLAVVVAGVGAVGTMAAAGAFALSRMGVPVGMLAGGAARSAIGAGGGMMAASRSGLRAVPGVGWLAMAMQLAPDSPIKDTHGMGGKSMEELEAQLARERGDSTWAGRRFRNNFGGIGAGVFDTGNWLQKQVTGQNYARGDYRAPVTALEDQIAAIKEERAGKMSLTKAGGGFQALGAGYEGISQAFGLVDNSLDGKDIAATLKRIETILQNQGSPDGAPPRIPPPGRG